MTVTGKQTVSISKKAVKSLRSTVDKQEHKTCKLKLRIAEKKCQTVFSFSEWILNRASKWHVQVPVTQRSIPKWRKQCCLPVQSEAATHYLDPLWIHQPPKHTGKIKKTGAGRLRSATARPQNQAVSKNTKKMPFSGSSTQLVLSQLV